MTSQTKKNQSKIIDGNHISKNLRIELQQKIHNWQKKYQQKPPKLIIIIIGQDPASHRYVQRKLEAAEDVGIEGVKLNYSDEITEFELLNIIEQLNNDETINGIIVQLPLPSHIDKLRIGNAISCYKDVDGFTEKNLGRLCLGLKTFVPCAALSVRELLKNLNDIETKGKNIVVIGTSKNFGMPIAIIMHNENVKLMTSLNDDYNCGDDDDDDDYEIGMSATVTMCNINTPLENLKEFCKIADILITITGVPNLIKNDMIKPGACVIDAGITPIQDENGETIFVGDVDFEGVKDIAGCITPVPGGVGPITITMLMKNTFKAAKIQAKKRNL